MANPSRELERRINAALERAFGAEAAGASAAVRTSQHADYQADVALALAKKVGKPPRKVAEALVAALERGDVCAEPTIAGPGFVNLTLQDEWIAGELRRMAADPRLDVAKSPR